MITREFSNFDLKQIAQSGQCFRMNETAPGVYQVISRNYYLEISQRGNLFTFHCPDKEYSYWLSYFDLETDYQQYMDSIRPKDLYLQIAAKSGSGIRILRQDPWEMVITFIISQQKTIPKIKAAVEALSRKYGSPIPKRAEGLLEGKASETWAFPSPAQLSMASLEDLTDLKLGYRAKYIHKVCQDACCGQLNFSLLTAMDYKSAMAYLTGFYGIGEKVANCICLFGLHHVDAFPVDTWIQKILLKEYYHKKYDKLPKNKLYETIVQDNFKFYRGYAGVMQQYIFFYERVIVQGKS